MNSVVYGVGNKHRYKKKAKSKNREHRGWNSGWGYCSKMQKVTK